MVQPVIYYQTDSRWSWMSYSNSNENATIGGSGCGPTAAAMVIATIADASVTPVTTCAWSVKNGYKVTGNGTANAYFVPQLAAYNIGCEYLSDYCYHNPSHPSHAKVKAALEAGNWVIANPGPGRWTSGGHFILVYGLQDGYVFINDPASSRADRLKATWADFIYEQKCYWIVTVPDSIKNGSGSTPAPTTPVKNYLVKGDTGADVGTMQTMLKAIGIYTGSVDNSFGPLTDTAVRAFQKAYNLTIDGSYGPLTKAKLEQVYAAQIASSASFTVGKNYTLIYDMKVRAGAGTDTAWKKRSELTADGQKNAYTTNNYAVLKYGTVVTVLEVVKKSDSEVWIRIPSGWIAAVYGGQQNIK